MCVLGMGGLGHLAIQFASAMGARVIVASRSEAKRADATRMGAEVAIDPDSEDLQAWMGQVDLILDTISNPHDLNRWFSTPAPGRQALFGGCAYGPVRDLPRVDCVW